MLNLNSKQVCENVRNYIMANFIPNISENPPTTFSETATVLLERFRRAKYSNPEERSQYHNNEGRAFEDWCAGLPSNFDAHFIYDCSAVDDLGDILEETEAEKVRYTDEQAEKLLTNLIYKELLKGENAENTKHSEIFAMVHDFFSSEGSVCTSIARGDWRIVDGGYDRVAEIYHNEVPVCGIFSDFSDGGNYQIEDYHTEQDSDKIVKDVQSAMTECFQHSQSVPHVTICNTDVCGEGESPAFVQSM